MNGFISLFQQIANDIRFKLSCLGTSAKKFVSAFDKVNRGLAEDANRKLITPVRSGSVIKVMPFHLCKILAVLKRSFDIQEELKFTSKLPFNSTSGYKCAFDWSNIHLLPFLKRVVYYYYYYYYDFYAYCDHYDCYKYYLCLYSCQF